MADSGGQQRRGSARRRWAGMGLLGRIVTAVVAVAVGFLALGAILASCGVGADEPKTPTTTSASPTPRPSTSSPTPSRSEKVTPPPRPTETVTETPTEPEPSEPTQRPESSAAPDVYYENCDAARADGAAPLLQGEPGYRPELDRDGDGIACDPYIP